MDLYFQFFFLISRILLAKECCNLIMVMSDNNGNDRFTVVTNKKVVFKHSIRLNTSFFFFAFKLFIKRQLN